MATLDVQRSWDTGTDQTLSDDGKVTLGAVHKYTIAASEAGLDSDQVRRQAILEGLLPAPSTTNPNVPAQYVDKVNVRQKSPIYFEATVNYKSPKLNPDDEEDVTPIDITTKVTWRTIKSEAAIDEDVNGDAIETVNGEPIGGLTRQVHDLSATLVKNFPSFDPTVLRAFMHTTNSDTFLGFPPGEGFIDEVSAEPQTLDGVEYWQVTTNIIFRTPYNVPSSQAWYKRVPHQGYLELLFSQETGELYYDHARSDLGGLATSPVWLDEFGIQIPVGSDKYFLTFQVYDQTAFSNLGYF